MKIYMAVTADRYELPIAVFDSIQGLSQWRGKSKCVLHRAIQKKQKDQKLNCRYIKVEVSDEDSV